MSKLDALKCFENMQYRIASNITTVEYTTIEKALQELQAIKNSNPSDALKVLNCNPIIREEMDYEDYYTINKALIKAQEQERVLNELKTLIKCADLSKQGIISLAVLKNAVKEVL